MRGWRPLLAAAAAVLLLATPAPASSDATVTVTVASDWMTYFDGTQGAGYEIACAGCAEPEPSHDVNTTQQTVRNAVLGMDVRRTSEPVEGALAQEQVETITVTLHEPGALHVELTAQPGVGFDPHPVPESAVPAGDVSDRRIAWTVPDAAVGSHTFSVRYDDGDGQSGSDPRAPRLVPRASIALRRTTDRLLQFFGGSIAAGQPITATSRLVLSQRTAPAYGLVDLSTEPFLAVPGSSDRPTTWQTNGSAHSRGDYLATLSGTRTAATRTRIADLVPAAGALTDLGANIVTAYLGVSNEGKADAVASLLVDGVRPVGFSFEMAAGGPQPSAPLGATLFDADTVTAPAIAGIFTVSGDERREPSGPAGTVGAVGTGGTGFGWTTLSARGLQGTFHEGLSHVQGHNLTWAATGDVDNRSGTQPVGGRSITLPAPAGFRSGVGMIVTTCPDEAKCDVGLSSTPEGPALTPRIGPGGYWLRSTLNGYDTDWAGNSFVVLTSDPVNDDAASSAEGPPDIPLRLRAQTVVPPGAAGEVMTFDVGGPLQRVALAPGVWDVRVAGGLLDVKPADQ